MSFEWVYFIFSIVSLIIVCFLFYGKYLKRKKGRQ
jgi:hypothetical protein